MSKLNFEEDLLLQLGILFAFGYIEDTGLDSINIESDSSSSKDSGNQNILSVKSVVKDKAVEHYGKKALENLKKTLQNSEPLLIGSIDKETIAENDINLTFQLKNVKIYNLGALQVKRFKSYSDKNMVEFAFAVPFLKFMWMYDVSGTFQNKKVQGKGDSEIQIKNVSVDDGRVVIQENDDIQIKDLSFCYTFKDITIKQTGLSIEGVATENVSDMLRTMVTTYFKDHKQKICNRIASEMKTRVNAKMKGKTRDQLTDLMK